MITLTPQARAVAAFTLAVLLITGDLNRVAFAVYSAFGGDGQSGEGARLVLGLLTVVLAAGVLWLAHTSAEAGQPGWDTNLAQVARVLAVIAIVISVLATIAALTNDDPFAGYFSLG
jgi:uncharacterized membrane protein